uniref:Uncharacterized protein n=1 Tax=Aegilops tauschii subsp. strangulata TaxID=200361 RepID=A0A453DGY7_AEGTS
GLRDRRRDRRVWDLHGVMVSENKNLTLAFFFCFSAMFVQFNFNQTKHVCSSFWGY